MKKFNTIITVLLTLSSLLQADTYILMMSKDDQVCQHMLSIYNTDLHKEGKLLLETHEEYSSIKWDRETKIMQDKYPYSAYVGDLKVSTFDINNDDKNESVVFYQNLWNYQLSDDRLTYYPSETMDLIKTGIQSRELFKGRLGADLMDNGGFYELHELPVQKILKSGNKVIGAYISTGSLVFIRPFFYQKKFYISLFGSYWKDPGLLPFEENNIVVIRQYQPDNTLKDICYYAKLHHSKTTKGEK
ncbi:hypothetical protein KKA17_10215 [bacterium]|nr:hypothetical protein [bacterium]MBU1883437.1 hypothetical protein [bacterium]